MIFGQLEPNGDAETLAHAVTAVRNRAAQMGLGATPWSLAELMPDEDDHRWLCAWAAGLREATVRQWFGSLFPYTPGGWQVTRQAAFGLLFLLFASEVARRDASEGTLWAYVCRDRDRAARFGPATEAILFVQGQPRYELKQAIEQAARTFNLRNVFGVSGLMNWFDSVFLQFGVTRRQVAARLPWLLAGYGTTQAINWLLSGERHSASFAVMWQALRDYRQNNITRDQCLERLRDTPWLVPEWIGDALEQARRKPELGTAASGGGPVDAPAAASAEVPFLAEPVLRWEHPGPPAFMTRVINIAAQGLEDPDYVLAVGGKGCATLVRTPDGAYAVQPDGEIHLPLTAPNVVASLVRRDGGTVRAQALALFDPCEEVTAFRYPTGVRIPDAWAAPLSPKADLLLLLSPDLTLTPEPARWSLLPGGAGRLCLLPAGWSPETRVCLDGEEFWTPRLVGDVKPGPVEQPWVAGVRVRWEKGAGAAVLPLKSCDLQPTGDGNAPRAWVRVDPPPRVRVAWVRAEGGPLEVFTDAASGEPVYGPLCLFDAAPRRTVVIGLEYDDGVALRAAIVRRPLDTADAGFEGAVRRTDTGWVALGPRASLSVWDAKSDPVRLFPPAHWGGGDARAEWGLIEGSAWVGSVGRVARPLGRLGGRGAALELRPRPYNCTGDALPLAAQVVDSGNVVGALAGTAQEGGNRVRLWLRHPVEPDQSYKVLWWDASGALASIPGDGIEMLASGAWNATARGGELSEPVVVGVAYDGVWRGAWWRDDWPSRIATLAAAKPRRTAALLRFFKLPLCAPQSIRQVQALFRRAPTETLAAWFTDAGLPDGLRHLPEDDWPATMRAIVGEWEPDRAAAGGLMRLLGGPVDDPFSDRLLATADRLNGVCPLLAARTARALRDAYILPQKGEKGTRVLLRRLCCRVAGLDPDADDASLKRRKEDLRDTAADMLGVGLITVDPAFVSSKQGGLVEQAVHRFNGKSVSPVHSANLNVALATVEPLRRLVAVTLIEKLLS